MSKRLGTEALIVSTAYHGDNHLICHLLTPDTGMIHAYARHARSRKSRFSSGLEVCDRGRIEYSPPRNEGLASLHEFITESSYPGLRTNLDCMLCANFLCELADRLIEDDAGDCEAAYTLLVASLESLSELRAQNEILKTCFRSAAFLLKHLGYDSSFTTRDAGSHQFYALIQYIEQQLLSSPLKTRTALTHTIQAYVKRTQAE